MNAMWLLALTVVGMVGASPLTRIGMAPKGVIEPLNITDRDSLQKFIEETSNDEDFMLEEKERFAVGKDGSFAGKGDEGFNYDDDTVREAVQKYIERTSNDADFVLGENEGFAFGKDEDFADEDFADDDEETFDDADDNTYVEENYEDEKFDGEDKEVTGYPEPTFPSQGDASVTWMNSDAEEDSIRGLTWGPKILDEEVTGFPEPTWEPKILDEEVTWMDNRGRPTVEPKMNDQEVTWMDKRGRPTVEPKMKDEEVTWMRNNDASVTWEPLE